MDIKSKKDLLLGAILVLMFIALLGAKKPDGKPEGRYAVAVGGGNGGYGVCVTDTSSGKTRCNWIDVAGETGFDPDFRRKPLSSLKR